MNRTRSRAAASCFFVYYSKDCRRVLPTPNEASATLHHGNGATSGQAVCGCRRIGHGDDPVVDTARGAVDVHRGVGETLHVHGSTSHDSVDT